MYWCYEDLQMYYETVGDGVPVLMLHAGGCVCEKSGWENAGPWLYER